MPLLVPMIALVAAAVWTTRSAPPTATLDAASIEAVASACTLASASALPTRDPLPPRGLLPRRGLALGDAEVRAEPVVLRLSPRVERLEGQLVGQDLVVTVHGALSLDRASPIATTSSSVESAAILNRGDHSELRIRFVVGRSPRWRVEADEDRLLVWVGR